MISAHLLTFIIIITIIMKIEKNVQEQLESVFECLLITDFIALGPLDYARSIIALSIALLSLMLNIISGCYTHNGRLVCGVGG